MAKIFYCNSCGGIHNSLCVLRLPVLNTDIKVCLTCYNKITNSHFEEKEHRKKLREFSQIIIIRKEV
jgi:hypothetical protein